MSDETAPQQPDTLPVNAAPAELPPAPGFFGSNQWIAIGAAVVSFAVATTFVFLGKATPEWWGTFVGNEIPLLVGLTIGGSALIKTAQVIRK
jgi:hypothetical protein